MSQTFFHPYLNLSFYRYSGKIDGIVDPYQPWQMTDRERELATKYVNLIQGKQMKKDPSLLSLTPLGGDAAQSSLANSNPLSPETPSGCGMPPGGTPSPCQESRAFVPDTSYSSVEPSPTTPAQSTSSGGQQMSCFVADIEEVRVSPVVSRRGTLSILEKGALGWVRRWVVVRRPYVFLFKDEKDCVERGVINLSTAIVEYSEDQDDVTGMANSFRCAHSYHICPSFPSGKISFILTYFLYYSVITKHRQYLMQTPSDKELYDWLYAMNPLLAGQIRFFFRFLFDWVHILKGDEEELNVFNIFTDLVWLASSPAPPAK